MIYKTNCPVCNSTHIKPKAHKGVDTDILSGTVGEQEMNFSRVTLYDLCLNCGVYFQNPRWSNEQVEHYYTSGLYRQDLKADEDRQDKDEMERALRNAQLIASQVGKFHGHLDVGAGRGYLLTTIKASFQVGVELDSERFQNDNAYWYRNLEDVNEAPFDLVTACHVLEHTADPMNFLAELIDCMKPEGHLVIEVPSDQSPGGWARPAHTFHFPPWTLHRMAQTLNMEIKFLSFTPHLFTIWKGKEPHV